MTTPPAVESSVPEATSTPDSATPASEAEPPTPQGATDTPRPPAAALVQPAPAASGTPSPTPVPKPDLTITSFSLAQTGLCAPNSAVYTFAVTVRNVGSATAPGNQTSPVVSVVDQHGNGWGNVVALGALQPGASRTVSVPVYYPQSNPQQVSGGAPHPFRATVDSANQVAELNEANNDLSSLSVPAPPNCG